MRLTPLARRLGSAALVLTIGVGATACSGDDSGSDPSSSATDVSGDSADESGDEPVADDESGDDVEAPSELSAADFYPAVMEAMREAETFTFETVTDAAGQAPDHDR